MRNEIILNNKSSKEIKGLLIQELPPISKPMIRTTVEEIDGRDGDIITKLGYSAYNKQISIGLHGDFDINEVIKYFDSEGVVTFSNEPDKYYKYQIIDQIDFERLIRFRTANITMHCQPFKYSTTEEPEEFEIGQTTGEGSEIELRPSAASKITLNAVKGDTEQQTYSGKNLFDYTKLTTINYGVNNGDGTLTSTQFTNATWSGLTANFTGIPITQEFTVSMEIRLTQGSTGVLDKINDGIADMTPVLKPDISTQWQKYAFKKTPSTGYSISRFYVQFQSINGSFEIKNIQLEIGSTPTSFEPYVGGTASPNPDYPQEVQTVTGRQVVTISDGGSESQEYEINLGKNLFDIDQYANAVTRGSTLVSLTKTSDTTLRTTNLYASTNNYCAIPIPDASRLLGHTITMSFSVSLTNVTAAKAAIFWKTTTNTVATQIGDTLSITTGGAKTLTFSVPDTFPSGTNGIFCTIYGSDTAQPVDSYVDWSNIQLERGSTATTYAPYFTPIELCKIGTYQDYIYKSGEDWYVHKETGKVTFTGAETETWSSATAATGHVRFSIAAGETHADNNGYCNELINRGSQSHGAYEYVWVQPNANAFYIQLLNTRANDLASFRTWLGANPATVYHNIATPTDTQITNSALIEELEAIYNANSYDEVTHVKSNSENLPMILNISVLSSNSCEVTNEGNIYSKPLLTIYGSGTINLSLNNEQMFVIDLGEEDNYVTIDTNAMEAYKDTVDNLMNRSVDGDYNNFKLNIGTNTLSWSGDLTKIVIDNYSRWI